jgi:phosphatidylglycerophosphate synthase
MRLWVDARERGGDVGPETVVGGLPLVARQVRQAARLRFAGAVIAVADEAGRGAVAAALSRFPGPPGFPVEIVVGAPAPARDDVVLPALAVYTAESLARAQPLADVRSVADVRDAERKLVAALRKSVDLDGVVAFYFMRPLSRQATRALLPTPVTPNQVTLAAMACGVAAALVAARGGYAAGAVAGLLFWLGAAVDCVDGELARLRVVGSRAGEWLDTLADDVSTLGLLVGLGVGVGGAWRVLGLVGAAVGAATSVKLYRDLHRLHLPIDTAQYPWFFGKASEGMPHARSGAARWARAFYYVSFLFRRDAFVTIVALLLFLGLRRIAMVILAGGATVFAILLVVHLLVVALRRRRASKR